MQLEMRGSGSRCSSSSWLGKASEIPLALIGINTNALYSWGFLLFYRREQLNRP